MTLIVALAGRHFAAQVSDTRLTWPDGRYRDIAAKTLIVSAWDSKLTVTFMGLAKIGHVMTEDWLAHRFYAMKTWEMSFPDIVERVRADLTAAARIHPLLRNNRTAVSFLGRGSKNQLAVCTVSNYMEIDAGEILEGAVRDRFDAAFHNFANQHEPDPFFRIAGAFDEKNPAIINSVRRSVMRGIDDVRTFDQKWSVVERLVGLIRAQAKDPKQGRLVSEDCIAVIVNEDFGTWTRFYRRDGCVLGLSPHVVREGGYVGMRPRALPDVRIEICLANRTWTIKPNPMYNSYSLRSLATSGIALSGP